MSTKIYFGNSSLKIVTMRKKEGLADYRYFPEPDLPEVTLTEEYVNDIRDSLPELPEMKRRRYEEMGLTMQDVLFLANDVNVAEFFDATIAKVPDVKLAANWIMGDIAAYMKNEKLSINEIKLSPHELSELIASIKSGTISGKIGKEPMFENSLVEHRIALPPDTMRKITYFAPPRQYSLKFKQNTVLELEFQGVKNKYTMLQTWPVRTPRPVASKLAADTPLLTGQFLV